MDNGSTSEKPKATRDEKKPDWAEEEPLVPSSDSTKPKASVSSEPKVEVDPALTAAADKRPPPSPKLDYASFEFESDKTPPLTKGRRYLGLPGWGWLLVVVAGLGALLLMMDMRNRDRYLMICKPDRVELHQGRTFPWPFGHVAMGGPQFKPVLIPAEADCRDRVFQSREEAELGYLSFILGRVRNALSNPGTSDLKEARQQLLQAMLLSRTHRARRKAARKMLAELAYRDGRAGLARVENELRTALSRFQEAQKLDGNRYEDLDDWISHLENLLRTIAPSPTPSTPRPFPFPLPTPQGPSTPAPPPGSPGLPGMPQMPTLDGGPSPHPRASDGGPSRSTGGILM